MEAVLGGLAFIALIGMWVVLPSMVRKSQSE